MTQHVERSRVFITGGTGFIGGCLLRRLLDEGKEVHLLLRDAAQEWRIEERLADERLRVHRGDVSNENEVRAALEAAEPEVVVHLAAEGAYEQQNDARRIVRTNVLTWRRRAPTNNRTTRAVSCAPMCWEPSLCSKPVATSVFNYS